MGVAEYDVPFPRSYWVITGLLLAGEYPGAKNHREAQKKLERLIDTGIQVVINLMEANEADHLGNPFDDYSPTIAQLAKIKKMPVTCMRFPIGDLKVPTAHEMDRIQKAITESI